MPSRAERPYQPLPSKRMSGVGDIVVYNVKGEAILTVHRIVRKHRSADFCV